MEAWMAEVRKHFTGRDSFTRSELWAMLRKLLPDQADTGIAWRIFTLKDKGVITNAARGVYTLNAKRDFEPAISDDLKEVFDIVKAAFPYAEYCFSDTAWFNDLLVHQVLKTVIILEVEKDTAMSVFNFLSEQGKGVFYEPDSQTLEFYVQTVIRPVIVKQLISQAPLNKEHEITIPRLEKLLVDLVTEKELYNSQHSELDHIYSTVKKIYNINQSSLLRYAGRRNRRKEVEALFKKYPEE